MRLESYLCVTAQPVAWIGEGMQALMDSGRYPAQVYPIWEGTTNVLALDTLRALRGNGIEHLREMRPPRDDGFGP